MSLSVVVPGGRRGQLVQVREGVALVRHGRSRAYYRADDVRLVQPLPIHRTEAGYPYCSTCEGGGCPDCTDPA